MPSECTAWVSLLTTAPRIAERHFGFLRTHFPTVLPASLFLLGLWVKKRKNVTDHTLFCKRVFNPSQSGKWREGSPASFTLWVLVVVM